MESFLLNKKNIIFDFDGVLADTNIIKSSIFKSLGAQFSNAASKYFFDYHINNGGISRHIKFSHYYKFLLDDLNMSLSYSEKDFCKLLANQFRDEFSNAINKVIFPKEQKILLQNLSKKYNLFILSGGDRNEILKILEGNDCKGFFKDVLGNEENKLEHINRLVDKQSSFSKESIFIGDSRYDAEVAKSVDLDFIFVYRYSEFKDWKSFCIKNHFLFFSDIMSFFNSHEAH